MQAFVDNARVQVDANGLYWYEQDILFSKYKFSDSVVVDMYVQYNRSGIGICIVEDNGYEDILRNQHKYIFRTGTNEFSVFEKHVNEHSNAMSVRTNVFSPASYPEAHLQFTFKNKVVTMKLLVWNEETQKNNEYMLGTHPIERKFGYYYIGVYSQAGNVIKSISFLQGVPDRWHTSINNVHGGRIAFLPDVYGFKFEGCIHDAELEQRDVLLKAGTYYFSYDTEEIEGKFDIEGTIYPSYIYDIPGDPNDPIDEDFLKEKAKYDETWFEDAGKNLLAPDGSFTLYRDTRVIISFKGTQGIVKNVCVKDDPKGEFVATGADPVESDGSWLTVLTEGLVSFSWEGVIWEVPEWVDNTELCPYGIVSTKAWNVPMETLGLRYDQWYKFNFEVATNLLTVSPMEGVGWTEEYLVTVTAEDENRITLFKNLRGQMANLTLVKEDGTEVNVNVQKIYKQIVPGYIKGPIIVTDNDNVSYDLSASYREVIDGDWVIESFNRSAPEILLSNRAAAIYGTLEVYGLLKGTEVDPNKNTWEEYIVSGKYDVIPFYAISMKNNVITLQDDRRLNYDRIAVRYQLADEYVHMFTLYEREIFYIDGSRIMLTHPINDQGLGLVVYGVPHETAINYDYLYRIPNKDTTDSIDYCCDEYVMIQPAVYQLDVESSELTFEDGALDDYELIIVDYLKKNSYCVNWNEDIQSYEVDISSDDDKIIVHYEMDETDVSSNKIKTEIIPNKNKFIVLKREKGGITDED